MAGDWLKWCKGLSRKAKVLRMASILKISRRETACALMELWEWCDDNVTIPSRSDRDACHGYVTLEGDATALNSLIDFDIVGIPGFADAMSAVGWLNTRNGSLEFPKLGLHNGQTSKERALAANRQKTARGKNGTVCNSTATKIVTLSSRSDRDESVTREEKRREENKDPPNPPLAGGARSKSRRRKSVLTASQEAAFSRFWSAYPRKEARGAAERAFAKVDPDESLLTVILEAIDRQKTSGCLQSRFTGDGRSTIPHPATWLNGRRWEDQRTDQPSETYVDPVQESARFFEETYGDDFKRPGGPGSAQQPGS